MKSPTEVLSAKERRIAPSTRKNVERRGEVHYGGIRVAKHVHERCSQRNVALVIKADVVVAGG